MADLQSENAKLRGRLEEREDFAKTVSARRTGPSFAEVATKGAGTLLKVPTVSRVNRRPEPGPKLVFIRPKAGEKIDGETAKKKVLTV